MSSDESSSSDDSESKQSKSNPPTPKNIVRQTSPSQQQPSNPQSNLKEIESIRSCLNVIYQALAVSGETFQQLTEYFDINMNPFSKALFALNEKMVDLAKKGEPPKPGQKAMVRIPAIKSRFYDGMRKEFDLQMDKKLVQFKDVVKKQTIMQQNTNNINRSSQFDNLSYRSKLIEQKLVSMNEEISDRPRKKDLAEFRDHFKIFQEKVYDHFRHVAEKEQVKMLENSVRDLCVTMESKINKEEFEKTLQTQLSQLETSIKEFSELTFAPKESTQNRISEIETWTRSQYSQVNLFKSAASIKLEQLADMYQKLQVDVVFRVKQEEFDRFKLYSADYLHKDEVKSIYDHIIPKVDKMSEDVTKFNQRLTDFQKFLNKTDYDVLYKASKMDFEMLARVMDQKQESLLEQYQKLNVTQNNYDKLLFTKFDDFQVFVNEFYPRNQETIVEQTRAILNHDFQQQIYQDVLKVFGSYNFSSLKSEIQQIKKVMDLKANKQDLVSIFENKSSKLSVETLAKILLVHQNHMKHIIQFTQQFMDLFSGQFDLESLNFKRQETTKIANEMMCLIKRLEGYDLTNLFDQKGIEPFEEEQQSPKKSKRQSQTPNHKVFLRPLLVNHKDPLNQTTSFFSPRQKNTPTERRSKSSMQDSIKMQRAKQILKLQ